jgi:hypothetical protein
MEKAPQRGETFSLCARPEFPIRPEQIDVGRRDLIGHDEAAPIRECDDLLLLRNLGLAERVGFDARKRV